MSNQLHRILRVAGSGLLAAAISLGSMAAADASVQPHGSASAKPNPASCPGPNNSALIPPAGGQPPAPSGKAGPVVSGGEQNSAGSAVAPASPCPKFGAGSDAETNIARGQALARPEPLNSKHLIAPLRH